MTDAAMMSGLYVHPRPPLFLIRSVVHYESESRLWTWEAAAGPGEDDPFSSDLLAMAEVIAACGPDV